MVQYLYLVTLYLECYLGSELRLHADLQLLPNL